MENPEGNLAMPKVRIETAEELRISQLNFKICMASIALNIAIYIACQIPILGDVVDKLALCIKKLVGCTIKYTLWWLPGHEYLSKALTTTHGKYISDCAFKSVIEIIKMWKMIKATIRNVLYIFKAIFEAIIIDGNFVKLAEHMTKTVEEFCFIFIRFGRTVWFIIWTAICIFTSGCLGFLYIIAFIFLIFAVPVTFLCRLLLCPIIKRYNTLHLEGEAEKEEVLLRHGKFLNEYVNAGVEKTNKKFYNFMRNFEVIKFTTETGEINKAAVKLNVSDAPTANMFDQVMKWGRWLRRWMTFQNETPNPFVGNTAFFTILRNSYEYLKRLASGAEEDPSGFNLIAMGEQDISNIKSVLDYMGLDIESIQYGCFNDVIDFLRNNSPFEDFFTVSRAMYFKLVVFVKLYVLNVYINQAGISVYTLDQQKNIRFGLNVENIPYEELKNKRKNEINSLKKLLKDGIMDDFGAAYVAWALRTDLDVYKSIKCGQNTTSQLEFQLHCSDGSLINEGQREPGKNKGEVLIIEDKNDKQIYIKDLL